MWDADFLYFAVAVCDDSVDVSRVVPHERVWHGPAGARKNRMFYYDHLKLFARAQSAALGHHVWIAPKSGDEPPYTWGHEQHQPGDEAIPVRVSGERVRPVYTYEVAIPWTWLGIRPRSGMFLKGKVLLVDSDLPGVEVSEKIRREESKWIW